MTATLTRTPVPSPFGDLDAITSNTGVVAILWPGDDRWTYPDAEDGTNAIAELAAKELTEYFGGTLIDFTVPLDLRGTEFQCEAWTALADIPYGETASYAEQAKRIGRPKAVRAVGAANGMNPVSVILPCHRVIGSNGKLTGYAGGLDAKKWLLDHESAQQSLV